MPARSALGGFSGVNPAAVINSPISPLWSWPSFHRENAAGRQPPRGLRNQHAVGVEAIGAAVQREERVVIADLGGETGDIGRADIGRVRHHQIEGSRQCRGIVAGDERRARCEPQASGIAACDRSRCHADIGADSIGIGNSDNSANRIAPEPVPISAMRNPRSGSGPGRSISSASSTTVSVSGLGTSVAAESCNGSPQNSLVPRMRATGSPARRRRAKSSSASPDPGDRPRRRRDQAGQIETQRRADQNPRVEFGRSSMAPAACGFDGLKESSR
jgi:hypothetical protein